MDSQIDKNIVFQTFSKSDYTSVCCNMSYSEYIDYNSQLLDFIEKIDKKYTPKSDIEKSMELYSFAKLAEFYIRNDGHVGGHSKDELDRCELILKSIYKNHGLERG